MREIDTVVPGRRPGSAIAAWALALGLAACAPPPPPGPEAPRESAAAELPMAYYRQLEESGQAVLQVDAADSVVVIEVRRGGPLARLGHDHVVASHDLQGWVAPAQGRADLRVDLARLVVDETLLRAAAGFDTEPSAAAIAGTRDNMLDKVLEVGRHPAALVRIDRSGDADELVVALSLHGITRRFKVPAEIRVVPEGLRVGGRLSLKQSDFGIVPLAVLGGALQVQDGLELRYSILARRAWR